MSQRRFIIFLLSSFFFLFLLFSTSPKTVYAGHTCPTTNAYCDGTLTCNDLCDPYGHSCGTVCGSCGVTCATPPPLGQCSTDADCPWPNQGADYCCGSSVCNNKTTYRCGVDSVCTRNSLEVAHIENCAYGCSNNACNPAPCDSRNGQECGSYGCCSSSNVESQCYNVYNCSGNCVYGGIRNEGAYCGNGACSCNETASSCSADCASPSCDASQCSSWVNGSCGAGGCASGQRQQTRTCPGGSTCSTSQCINDSTCGAPPPGPDPTPPPGSCYDGVLQNNYTTGSCTVTIRHLGFDNSDGVIGGYANVANSSTYRTINMNDSDLTCKPNINLQFTNNWGASSSRNFSITDTINSKNAGNTLGAGWQLNSAGCTINDCITTQVGPSQRTTNSGSDTYTATLHYCGDGQCDCGKTASTCPADCAPAAPTGLSASCPVPGDTANLSWNSVAGATYYNVSYDALSKNNIAGTATTISGLVPGSSHTWSVRACNAAGCSAPATGTGFTCAMPTCPGGLGACGDYIPTPNTIGACSGTWAYNPGPSLAYNQWCAANANPTRGYCYQCNTNITPWIQTTGDVHSDIINAPGGP